MANSGLYRDSYPRQGDVAVLCEGDLVGYEASILKGRIDARSRDNPDLPFVDVWPCGTSHSVFGMADAIGRAVPVASIEDRDFRTPDEGRKDSQECKKGRERRGVRVLDWRTWQRNEIENYLLDLDVLSPVMETSFGCSSSDVQEAISHVLPAIAAFQAAQYIRYRVQRSWSRLDPSVIIYKNLHCRPSWDPKGNTVVAPDPTNVRDVLCKNVDEWNALALASEIPVPERLHATAIAGDFEERYDSWRKQSLTDTDWRLDWAGKEVLSWLRVCLSGRYGWRDPESGVRSRISWDSFNRRRFDERDRILENDLKPYLVHSLLAMLLSESAGGRKAEWLEIEEALAGWQREWEDA